MQLKSTCKNNLSRGLIIIALVCFDFLSTFGLFRVNEHSEVSSIGFDDFYLFVLHIDPVFSIWVKSIKKCQK